MNVKHLKLLTDFAQDVAVNGREEWFFVRRASMRLWKLLDNSSLENERTKALLCKIHSTAMAMAESHEPDGEAPERLLRLVQELAGRCGDRRVSHPFVIRAVSGSLRVLGA